MQKKEIGAVTDIPFSMSLWHKEYIYVCIYVYITSIEWIFSLWKKNYNKLYEIKVTGRNSTKIAFYFELYSCLYSWQLFDHQVLPTTHRTVKEFLSVFEFMAESWCNVCIINQARTFSIEHLCFLLRVMFVETKCRKYFFPLI